MMRTYGHERLRVMDDRVVDRALQRIGIVVEISV